MAIDIAFLILLILGFYLGFRNGLIKALFAFVSLFIGAAVAVKFTAIVSQWLYGNFDITTHYLPFIVFLLLFILVVILVRLIGTAFRKAAETLSLGYVDQILGATLWCVILTFLLSLFLWFSESAGMLSKEIQQESYTYEYVHLAAPLVLDVLAGLIPWFEGMFDIIKHTLDKVAKS